jgi:hypothetical protein
VVSKGAGDRYAVRTVPRTAGQRADFTAIGIDRFRGDLVVERSAWSDLADLVCQRGHQTLTVPPVAEP